MASLLSLTKQVSLGVLPACLFASAVPDRIQFWLNIDFARARKIRPGGNFRVVVRAGQELPLAANLAGWKAAKPSTFHKSCANKPAQMLEKHCISAAQKSVKKCEFLYGKHGAARCAEEKKKGAAFAAPF